MLFLKELNGTQSTNNNAATLPMLGTSLYQSMFVAIVNGQLKNANEVRKVGSTTKRCHLFERGG
jgi:hypothetical protein